MSLFVRSWRGVVLSSVGLLGVYAGALFLTGCNDTSATSSPTAPAPAASTALPSDEQLKARLDAVIDEVKRRRLNPKVNNAWQIVHGVLSYGYDLQLSVDGQPVTKGLDWILNGGEFKGWVFTPGEKGLESPLDPGSKVGSGHEDQWVGYMSQCGVPMDTPLIVNGTTYHVRDLLTQAEWDTRDGMEATWTLMALCTYMPPDHSWVARDGSKWNIDRLVAMETPRQISNLGEAACGGSHRMYTLAVAVNRRLRAGGPLDGGWAAAQKMIDECVQAARMYQQPDGSFSTNYFQRSGTAGDVALRLNNTGHTFEFLAVCLPDEELSKPWMVRACVSLLKMFEMTKDLDQECGGLYHASHGLRIYRARRFGEDATMHPVASPLTAK
ncbi:MAG: ADP-ribosylation factor-directed GTPase activating protein isoform b [Planctomycetes bacterium]|nr:ADP-ribosylation factor-directed GTPase activating protein isoform b [Planctomycetota bacterium]